MEPHTVYTHSIESLRFAFQAIGYDNCIKELAVIKHIYTVAQEPISKKLIAQEPVAKETYTSKQESPIAVQQPVTNSELPQIVEDMIPKIAHEPESDNKNIIIEAPIKYSRSVPPDTNRCVKILDGNIRCSFKRATDSERCSRHDK